MLFILRVEFSLSSQPGGLVRMEKGEMKVSQKRLGVFLATTVGLLGFAVTAVASPVLTGVNSYNTDANGNALGTWRTNTQGGFPSNTYITQGMNPGTDAFLYTGNPDGALLGSGLMLGEGTYTFYLWGVTGYQPDHGVSLSFGGATNPSISSWYRTSSNPQNTLSGAGLTIYNDFDALLVGGGGGLSAVFGIYTVEITNWSMEIVTRGVIINSYDVVEGPSVDHNVGRLELRVTNTQSPPTPVPQPGTLALLAPAVFLLARRARNRRAVS